MICLYSRNSLNPGILGENKMFSYLFSIGPKNIWFSSLTRRKQEASFSFCINTYGIAPFTMVGWAIFAPLTLNRFNNIRVACPDIGVIQILRCPNVKVMGLLMMRLGRVHVYYWRINDTFTYLYEMSLTVNKGITEEDSGCVPAVASYTYPHTRSQPSPPSSSHTWTFLLKYNHFSWSKTATSDSFIPCSHIQNLLFLAPSLFHRGGALDLAISLTHWLTGLLAH